MLVYHLIHSSMNLQYKDNKMLEIDCALIGESTCRASQSVSGGRETEASLSETFQGVFLGG